MDTLTRHVTCRVGGVEKSPAGSAGAIYDRFGQLLHVFGVVSVFIAVVIDDSCPAAPNADNAIAFPSARIVIALIAGFKPGTSPPPVRIAIVPLLLAMPQKYRVSSSAKPANEWTSIFPYRLQKPAFTI